MTSNIEMKNAIDLINRSHDVLITTHTRPDGDACGCAAALCEVLAALGKKIRTLFVSEVPEWYQFLFGEKVPVLGADTNLEQLRQQLAHTDLIIIIDTNSYSQLPGLEQVLREHKKPVLVIDHHVTSDGLGDVELVDPSASAAGIILYDLFKYANWPVSPRVATALFVAIATDTGWFRFSSTDARTYRAAAELTDAGADPTRLYHDLYQNFSHQRFQLMTAMLNTLEFHLNGRFATQYLTRNDFEHTGAAYSDTENLIDECQRIGTVETAALFVELKDGRIRCSLRSRGGVDVSKIAQKFGGGGHKMAAGAYLPGPIQTAKQLIIDQIALKLPEI